MIKTQLHLKTTVLEGNKIEINDPNLKVGETVEVLITLPQENTEKINKSKAVKAYLSSKEEWKEVDLRLAQS